MTGWPTREARGQNISFISVLRHLPNVCVSRFEQKQTSVVSLLSLAGALFHQGRGRGSSASCFSQLLIIVSDGRGIFHEGREKVTQVNGLVYATQYLHQYLPCKRMFFPWGAGEGHAGEQTSLRNTIPIYEYLQTHVFLPWGAGEGHIGERTSLRNTVP